LPATSRRMSGTPGPWRSEEDPAEAVSEHEEDEDHDRDYGRDQAHHREKL
jgi:hypothetical protein